MEDRRITEHTIDLRVQLTHALCLLSTSLERIW